jgi:hypothetical protein
MKKLFAVLVGLYCALGAAAAQYFTTQQAVAYNLIADFGAVCNGVADDGPALAAAGAKFRMLQPTPPYRPIDLIIPSGANCTLSTCPAASDGGHAFGGVTNLTIIATGATITMPGGNCHGFTSSLLNPWTADFFFPNNIGDTCVTMKVAGAELNYPVGHWVLMSGQGVQVNSYPPNYATFEYLQVLTNTVGGHQLCFTTPIQNFYPDDARAGIDLIGMNCSNNYCGGPGAISLMAPTWGGYIHFIGGDWNSGASTANGFLSTAMNTVIFDNVTWEGGPPTQSNQCWYASFIGTVTFNNTNFTTCNMEVDKEIDQIIVNNTTFRTLQFQSPSYHSITVNNSHPPPGNTQAFGFNGTPPHTTCNNSTIGLAFGNTFGSAPQTFVGNNCSFTLGAAPFNGVTLDHVHVTYANGTFSVLGGNLCAGLPQWFSQGGALAGQLINGGANDADNYFTVTGTYINFPPASVNCNQTIFVTTTLSNPTDPPPPFVTGGTFAWTNDQARDISCTGCSGDRLAFDQNFPAAQHKPLYTYLNRTYTCPNNLANVPGSFDLTPGSNSDFDGNMFQRGKWVLATINVVTADTNPADAGAGPIVGMGAGQIFNPITGAFVFSGRSTVATVNLLIAGTRTISPTMTTGAQSGDTLTPPTYGANSWVGGSSLFLTSGNWTNGPAAQCPVVQIIFQTTR